MNQIKARQYAQAIYDIANENNQIDDYLNLSLAIIDVFNSEPELLAYLKSWDVDQKDKQSIIKEICDGYEYYMNWLLIIIESDRANYIKEYINEYISIYNEAHNIEKGYAYTTEFIDKELIKKLEEAITKKLNKKVSIENRIDKNIIGGIKLKIGDDVWDNSIKNKLQQLLTEGSGKNE